MRHIFDYFMASMALLVVFGSILCCSEERIPQDEGEMLYEQMLIYSKNLMEFQNHMDYDTLMGIQLDETDLPFVDISIIDSNYLYYMESYTQPENILDWDEMSILNEIAADQRLSEEDKTCLVKTIAGVYSIKQLLSQTRTDRIEQEICNEELAERLNSIITNYTTLMGYARAESSWTLEQAANIYYSVATRNAVRDYRKCLKSSLGINCGLEDGYDDYDDYDVYFNEEDDGADNGFPPEEDDNNDDAGLDDENNWPEEEEAFEEE